MRRFNIALVGAFALLATLLATVGFFAAFFPVRRLTALDPAAVLRQR